MRRLICLALGLLALGASGDLGLHRAIADLPGDGRPLRGVPDQSFGTEGRAFAELPPAIASSKFTALSREPSGKLLLRGVLLSGKEPVIERRNPDGQLDPSFGEGGIAPIGADVEPSTPAAVELGLQSDGGIAFAETGPCAAQTFIRRLHDDGSADSSFGAGGKTELGFAISQLTIDSEDRILVLGSTGAAVCAGHSNPPKEAKVARLLPDGALDPTFGTDGIASPEVSGKAVTEGISLASREDGTIIVLATGSQEQRVLVGLTPSGSVDPSFGSGGAVAVDKETAKLLGLPGGRILTANQQSCCGVGVPEIVVRRFLPEGKPDPGFGEAGRAHFAPLPGSQVEALAAGPDGTILASAHAKTGGLCDKSGCEGMSFLARLTAGGQLDSSFGGGWLALDVHSGQASDPPRVLGLAAAPSGQVYAAGDAGDKTNAFLFAREADGTPSPGFGSGGFVEEVGAILADTSSAQAVLEPDGETVISADTDSGARERRHVLIYFRADGSLNTSRGSGSGFVGVRALAMMARAGAGRIYTTARHGSAIVRIGPGGETDPSFGRHGIASLPPGFKPRALLPRRGKLLIAGAIGDRKMATYKLDGQGKPDRGFGRNGLAIVRGHAFNGASAVAADRRGRILLLGAGLRSSSQLVRLLPNGKPDRSFGEEGTSAELPSYLLQNPRLSTLPGGGILIAGGFAATGGVHGRRASLLRVDARGQVLRSFGRNGSLHVPGFGVPLGIFPSGRGLILATAAPGLGRGGLTLRAYSREGTVDRRFGRHGKVRVGSTPTVHFGPLFAGRQRNGRIVVVGNATHRYGAAEPELLRFR